jgi:hypothetical protein
MNDSKQADIIKIAAVLTAAPRWAGALMAADGVTNPTEWGWWLWVAFGLSLAMAAVEGFAISFVFNAWRNQHDKRSRWLLFLAILMLADFVIIVAPYVVANVSGEPLTDVLGTGWLLWVWSVAVAASTGLVVGSVGYAQKEKPAKSGGKRATSETKPTIAGYTCGSCKEPFASQAALNAHGPARCADKLAQNGKEPTEIIERSA